MSSRVRNPSLTHVGLQCLPYFTELYVSTSLNPGHATIECLFVDGHEFSIKNGGPQIRLNRGKIRTESCLKSDELTESWAPHVLVSVHALTPCRPPSLPAIYLHLGSYKDILSGKPISSLLLGWSIV